MTFHPDNSNGAVAKTPLLGGVHRSPSRGAAALEARVNEVQYTTHTHTHAHARARTHTHTHSHSPPASQSSVFIALTPRHHLADHRNVSMYLTLVVHTALTPTPVCCGGRDLSSNGAVDQERDRGRAPTETHHPGLIRVILLQRGQRRRWGTRRVQTQGRGAVRRVQSKGASMLTS
jgi:hypothetical protein